MGRRPAYAPLRVYLNNRGVGTLSREASGAIDFSYHEDWLGWEHALPVSLSLFPYAKPLIAVNPLRLSLKIFCRTRTRCAAMLPKRSAHAA